MAITAILPDQVLANGASDGDLLTVQADGSVAFEAPAGGGGIGGSTGSVDNAVLTADGTGGSTLQATQWIISGNVASVSNDMGTDASASVTFLEISQTYSGTSYPSLPPLIRLNYSGNAGSAAKSFAITQNATDVFYIGPTGSVICGNITGGVATVTRLIANNNWTGGTAISGLQPTGATVPGLIISYGSARTFESDNGRTSIYNTYTSSTSYERLDIDWDTNVCTIQTAAGSAGGTKRGVKFGGASTDELGFFGATPVDQPATVADPSGGSTVDTEARAAIAAVIDRLQELGLMA